MANNPFLTPAFRQLLTDWNRRLKEAGFEDAENDSATLKLFHSTQFRRERTLSLIHQKRDYYDRASSFLHEHTFQSETDKSVWEHHAEGEPVRDIARSLGINVNRVHKVICEMRELMLKGSE